MRRVVATLTMTTTTTISISPELLYGFSDSTFVGYEEARQRVASTHTMNCSQMDEVFAAFTHHDRTDRGVLLYVRPTFTYHSLQLINTMKSRKISLRLWILLGRVWYRELDGRHLRHFASTSSISSSTFHLVRSARCYSWNYVFILLLIAQKISCYQGWDTFSRIFSSFLTRDVQEIVLKFSSVRPS